MENQHIQRQTRREKFSPAAPEETTSRVVPRKLRIQYAGALYHVIRRGKGRRPVFADAGSAKEFEQCLYEICERQGWKLHAYAILRNSFHLALETPRANLVQGMHALQTTYAARRHGFHQTGGQLFHGRYQALLIEPGPSLERVVEYIHLVPVLSGIIGAEHVRQFRWGSLRLAERPQRPPFVQGPPEGDGEAHPARVLRLAKENSSRGLRSYRNLTRGWAIGSAAWKASVVADRFREAKDAVRQAEERRSQNERAWHAVFQDLLREAGKTEADAASEACSAPWKVQLAIELRRRTGATQNWIAEMLGMGKASSLSVYLLRHRVRTMERAGSPGP